MNEVSVKKNCLYGPKRENANTAIQDFLVKDHVFANDGSKEKKWETTSHACFGKKNVKLDKDIASRRTEIQRTSNFEFGSDPRTHPLTTTTSFEFCKNALPPVKRACHNCHSTNIPDFSHSLMQGKTIGNDGSIYASSYHMSGRKVDPRKLRDIQKKQTDDMKSTHFNLGSNKQRTCSETLHSYHSRCMQNSDCIESSALKKTAPSSVFRSGDWNMSEPCVDTTSSVSQDDFGPHQNIPSFTSRNASSTKQKNHFSQHANKGFIAQSATNFKFGSDKCLNSSLYQKDFQLEKSHQLKPLKTARPKSSKFLQQTPGMVCPKSTEESDFVYKHDKALEFLTNRMHEFERNQDRHKISCVALSDEQELMKPKQVSMTFKDYQEPSTELLRSHTLQRRPAPKYDYIHLDKGLIEPQYETTQKDRKHQAHLSKLLVANSSTSKECGERARDDHQTHFAFGSDFLSTVQSEQHDQFTLKNPLDPCYPAAGNNRVSVLRNTHIYARDDDSVDESLRKSSVMKSDYQPSTKQRVSTAQRRLLDLSLKYPLVIAPSHYFHMKHDHGRTLPTTTTDYIPPEFMTGQA